MVGSVSSEHPLFDHGHAHLELLLALLRGAEAGGRGFEMWRAQLPPADAVREARVGYQLDNQASARAARREARRILPEVFGSPSTGAS